MTLRKKLNTNFCHLCVVSSFDNQTWLDVDGLHQGIPDNCYFSNPVEKIELVPLSKNDAAELFTSDNLDQRAIKTAEQFIMRDPNLSKLMK